MQSDHTKDRGHGLQSGLELIADITQALATSLELGETLDNALTQIMDYLDAEAASIFLLENDGKDLVCRACGGPNKITGIRIGATEGIVGKAIREKRVQMVRDVTQDPSFAPTVDQQTGFTTRSILCAPLLVKGARIGAMELVNKRSGDGLFDSRDQHLLTAMASSAALAIHNAAMAAELVEQERLKTELRLARDIQESLLPATSPAGFPVRGLNIPVYEVSGDFFDYYPLPDGRIVFALADVSGKGMNAALLMAKASSLFRCLAKTLPEPGHLLARLNAELGETITRGMFVTMVAGVYEPETGVTRIANAGHMPPLLLDSRGKLSRVEEAAPPLGILLNPEFPEVEVNLNGGSLYLYTDGLTELRRPDGSELDIAGLERLILEARATPATERLRTLADRAMTQCGKPHDDISLLLLETEQRGEPALTTPATV